MTPYNMTPPSMVSNATYILDSSVWIGLFLATDIHHADAVLLMQSIEGSPIMVPYCVMSEVVTLLTYRIGAKQGIQFMEYITDHVDITLLENHSLPEMRWFRTLNAKISFTDACLIYLALEHEHTLVTFDIQMQKIYQKTQ